MNYNQETLRAMQTLAQKNPDFELGEIVFTAWQSLAVKNGESLDFLRHIKSEDLYTCVEIALNKDFKDTEMTNEEWELWTNKKQ